MDHASFFFLSEPKRKDEPATTVANRAEGEVSEGRNGAKIENTRMMTKISEESNTQP